MVYYARVKEKNPADYRVKLVCHTIAKRFFLSEILQERIQGERSHLPSLYDMMEKRRQAICLNNEKKKIYETLSDNRMRDLLYIDVHKTRPSNVE